MFRKFMSAGAIAVLALIAPVAPHALAFRTNAGPWASIEFGIPIQ